MTSKEFERGYMSRSGIGPDLYNKHFITLTCSCDYTGCQGWAAIGNNPDSIKHHYELEQQLTPYNKEIKNDK